jgi:tetratricopeptide (TPR) repeat protein
LCINTPFHFSEDFTVRCNAAVLAASALLLFAPFCRAQSLLNPDHIPPLSCNEVVEWLAGGISSQRVAEMADAYGIAFSANADIRAKLQEAGAKTELLNKIHFAVKNDTHCSSEILKVGALVRREDYENAETILRRVLESGNNSERNAFGENAIGDSALHFALAYVRQQQGDWDEAFDEYSEAKERMPSLPEVHSRLGQDFYESNDGDNTIAEARTALSLDPHNAEGYRVLGLGLYADEKYEAALHSLNVSLAYDPHNTETYMELGMTFRALHELGKALDAYQSAANGFKKALRAHASAQNHFSLGGCYIGMEEYGQALREFNAALALKPEENLYRTRRQELMQQMKLAAEAPQQISSVLRIHDKEARNRQKSATTQDVAQ